MDAVDFCRVGDKDRANNEHRQADDTKNGCPFQMLVHHVIVTYPLAGLSSF